MKRLFAILALLFVAFALQPNAQATSTAIVVDQKICKGSAAASGGTFACDWATTTDRATRLVANVGATALSASHLTASAFVTCEAIYENQNGTVSAVTAVASGNNPTAANTTTFVAAHAQGTDSAFHNGSTGADVQCVWSISGTNARVTVTNNSQTSTAADVTVWIQGFTFGSQ